MVVYDVAIIGAGLVGSAAARHCTLLDKTSKIVLIGPSEPKREDYKDETIFGGYFDEGRITRHLSSDTFWSYLAKESIKRYKAIEAASNINFYTENGYLALFSNGDSRIQDYNKVSESLDTRFQVLPNVKEIKAQFPFMEPLHDMYGLYESKNAGTINPRALITAQQRLAIRAGAMLIRDTVVHLEQTRHSLYQLVLKSGEAVLTRKVILCTGAFLFHNSLIPKHLGAIDVKLKMICTARIAVTASNLRILNGMPSLAMMTKSNPLEPSPLNEAFYMMAPIKYPNGIYYLKVGLHGDSRKGNFGTPGDISEWYKCGSEKVQDLKLKMATVTEHFLPGLKPVDVGNIVIDTCAITETPDNRPFVDQLSENLFIFTGCNGYAAKSSDEFGRLLANLALLGKWDCPFSQHLFRCRFRKSAL